MMYRFFLRSALLGAIFFSLAATASPMYYTFEGVVNWGPIDDLNMIPGSSSPFGTGDSVSMIWEVDLGRPGEVVDVVNNTTTLQPSQAYARLVSGAMLSPAEIGLNTFDIHKTVFNISGTAAFNANLEDYAYNDANNHHYFQIRNDAGATVSDYHAGASGFSLYERVLKDGVATRYQVLNGLTLTSISDAYSVPAPSTWLIFTGALIGLGFNLRRWKTRQDLRL